MSESTENPEGVDKPEAAEAAEAVVVEPAAPKARGARRAGRVVAVAGSVLLACAVVGGVGYTVVTVQDADRASGKPTWKFPAAAAEGDDKAGKKAGAAGSGLSGLMLPFGTDGYQRGPDLDEFGPDSEFSGPQAIALRKESIKNLPSASRRKLEKEIDKERIKGMAMRSYVVGRPDYNTTDAITFDVTLSRQENRTAVHQSAKTFSGFLAATDVFRKGPKIKGHPDAQCFVTPKGEDEDLALGLCIAAVGDVLVSVTSEAPDPIDGTFVAKFFAAQLDRIDDPGQAV
ncbi:hypothetical protein [Streptomyces sp. NPDC050121]|uniref:hypothetical protein n=1 Tax=Streptomyces sp. NPDC050121 TaxID=3365601 RepID=UPI003795D252